MLQDFDDDNDITKYDLIDLLDKLTFGSELLMDEKTQICDIVSFCFFYLHKKQENVNKNKAD